MTSVLVGQSYYLRFDPKLWDAMQPYPPFGSMYAAAELRAPAATTSRSSTPCSRRSEDEWGEAIARHRPDVAVIFEDNFNYLSKMCLLRMRTAAFRMLELARRAGCMAVVCGSDATDHAEQYLDHGADFVVVGEGEVTLGGLLEHVDRAPHVGSDGALRSRVPRRRRRRSSPLARRAEPEGPRRAARSRRGTSSTSTVTGSAWAGTGASR